MLALAVPRAAVAAPGLWVVRSGGATAYLFGTVHLLQPNMDWESAEVASAFAESSELWLEIPNPADPQSAQGLVKAYGFDPDHPLSSKLSPQDLAKLAAAAKLAQLPRGEATLEPMYPWLAAMTLEDELLLHAGYNAASGVENALARQAGEQQKLVFGFETIDQQIRLLADLSPKTQIQMLENSLDEFDGGTAKLQALIDAWMADDQPALTHLVVDDVKTLPALYQTLLVKRNEDWVSQIETMLKKPGTRFIAVGAGHLAGPDSVLAKLAQHGLQVVAVTGPARRPQSGR